MINDDIMLEDAASPPDFSQLPENQSELLAEFERRKRVKRLKPFLNKFKKSIYLCYFELFKARQIHVSTDDTEVKLNLRQLSEPICNLNISINNWIL